ncbi:cytochrome P450 [Dentipellis sp. KUC8613]|nr:cytochrome P450 [Dentipellis sp. KUC8613]
MSLSSASPLPLALVVVLAVGIVAVSRSAHAGKQIPGPRGLPLLGNLLDLVRAARPHLLFPAWHARFGPLVRFDVLGFRSVLVSDYDIVVDLLEKRGAIYSDRPNMVLENEILGWDAAMPTMRYGAQFRKHRRLSQALLNPTAARSYADLHSELAERLIDALRTKPEKFHDHILVYATSTIFRLTYDLDVTSDNDHLARLANDAVKKSAEAYQASGALVDVFPSLKWLYTSYPDWAPFSGFKRTVAAIRAEVVQANGIPYSMVADAIRANTARPSLVHDAIANFGGLEHISAEDEADVRGLAGILYGAGQETTMATLNSFILAMVRTPSVQRAAHAELDAVLPRGTVPSLDDRARLPYLEALVKEVYRWACPLSIAIPHTVIQDDTYDGYFIPKGTSIIANLHAILTACPAPTSFNPTRFLPHLADAEGQRGAVPRDPRDVVFGFGRRRCPGAHVADNSVWTAIARMLAAFEFLPAEEGAAGVGGSGIGGKGITGKGKARVPEAAWGQEMARHPLPFECRIVERVPGVSRLEGLVDAE